MVSKLPMRLTVLLTYFNFNNFYKNMHYNFFHILIDKIKICQKGITLKLFNMLFYAIHYYSVKKKIQNILALKFDLS